MLARSADRLAALETEVAGQSGVHLRRRRCGIGSGAAIGGVTVSWAHLGRGAQRGGRGSFGTFLDVDPDGLERNFRVNVVALLHLGARPVPDMIARGQGALVVTGNTSALRGKPAFAVFAPTKAAQRILAQSIAREVGPKGVHVAYVVIDAVIDVPWTRQAFGGRPDDFFIQPRAIAEEIWRVAHQDRSAWSFDVELRPFGETW